MKKLFELILLILFIIFGYLYINKVNTKEDEYNLLSIIEKNASITNYYIYGNHFNINGILDVNDINPDDLSLILKNKDEEIYLDCNFEVIDNKINFYTSNLINRGINLDKLNRGNYYLLIKFDNKDEIKYYSLKNDTTYDNMEYYTITKKNSNNKIDIIFDKELINDKSINYTKIDIKKTELPNDIYDITIDPGHGGIDTGANYKYNGNTYYESNIALDIALKLKKKLENNGYKVLLTRDKDINLDYYNESGRATLPNKYHTKLCISLHLNSDKSNMKYGGVEVYIPNDADYELARLLSNNLASINGYSKKKYNKIEDGIYFNGFTEDSIIEANKANKEKGINAYDILVGAPEMYMIREVGGIQTHAYVDGRNDSYGINPYYNSNQTAEGYLIELGYISYEEDLNKLINEPNSFSKEISNAIVKFYK